MSIADKIRQAQATLRLPDIAERLGLHLPTSPGACLSPFREERNPSFSWFVGDDGKDRWKDFASGEHGDSLDFIVKASGIVARDAAQILIQWAGLHGFASASFGNLRALPRPLSQAKQRDLPGMPPDLRQATQDDLAELIRVRGWGISPDRLQGPADSLHLMFGALFGQRAWLLIDRKGGQPRFFEARRMDGNPWGHGAKSHARGRKALLGAEKLNPGAFVFLVEGAPDFLAASILCAQGRAWAWPYAAEAVPVAMLGAGVKISPEDLESFRAVRVVIVPHLDRAGGKAADQWAAQLKSVASAVRVLDLTPYTKPGGKDLADCLGEEFGENLLYRVQAYSDTMKGGRV